MPPFLSGRFWRAVFTRTRGERLWAGHRRTSGGPGCRWDALAGADVLRAEPDRFGGISVPLERFRALDRLDAASFQKVLQGKCALAEGFPGFLSVSNEVTGCPASTSHALGESSTERADVTCISFPCFVLVPFAGRFLRQLGEMVTIVDFEIGSTSFW